jgi:hypothetical protein
MKTKFHGSFEDLQTRILTTGIDGEWRDLGIQQQYRARNGGILNWWMSTGTIFFQGPAAEAKELATAFNRTVQAHVQSGQTQVTEARDLPRLQQKNAIVKQRLANVMFKLEMMKFGASAK